MPADTQEGDILLIATAGMDYLFVFEGRNSIEPDQSRGIHHLTHHPGAYGHSMASHYNLREPASELYLAQEHSGGGQGKTLGLS